MNNQQQSQSWDKETCQKWLKFAEVVKRLNDNPDFLEFRKLYIDEQIKDLTEVLVSESIGHPIRQQNIEKIIGVNNLKFFLDKIVFENKESAEMYLKDILEQEKSKDK